MERKSDLLRFRTDLPTSLVVSSVGAADGVSYCCSSPGCCMLLLYALAGEREERIEEGELLREKTKRATKRRC